MTIQACGVVDTKYGPKFEFKIHGDISGISQQIKSLDWEKTHYEYLGEEKDHKWRIDATEQAVQEVYNNTSISIPNWVLYDGDTHVSITIPEDSIFMEIHGDDIIYRALRDSLSYKVEWYDKRAGGHKHDIKNIVEWHDGDVKVPIGLKNRVVGMFNAMDIEHTVFDYRQKPDWGKVSYNWDFPHDLRDYQKETMAEMLKDSMIVQLPTGSGKTVIALRTVHELGMPTIVLVHTLDLLNQWKKRVSKILGVEPGIVQGDTRKYRNITIAMMQTLQNTDHKIDDFDIFISDECHHLPADEFYKIAMRVNAHHRFGLSATGDSGLRDDDKGIKLVGGIGPIGKKVAAQELIDEGYLAEPTFEWLYPPRLKGSYDNWQNAYREHIVENESRNNIAIDRACEEIEDGNVVLIDVKRIAHGERLISKMPNGLQRKMWRPEDEIPTTLDIDVSDVDIDNSQHPIPIVHDGDKVVSYDRHGNMQRAVDEAVDNVEDPVFWLRGEDDDEIREHVLDLFRKRKVKCLVSTLLREGIDVPEMDTIILAGGGKSSISLIQTIGRVLRPETDGATVIDFVDKGEFVGKHHKDRVDTMKSYYKEQFTPPEH